jgi:hypothetical protein
MLFLTGDDEKAKDAMTEAATDEVVEVVGHIPAAILAPGV